MFKSNQRDPRLGIIFLTVFLDLVGFSMIFPLFPAILKWYLPREADGGSLNALVHWIISLSPGSSVEDWQVIVLFGGVLGALYSVLQFISAPIWGSLSDFFGRRRIILISLLGSLTGYITWGLSGSFIFLVFARLINGLMAGNLSVATAAIADITDEKSRSKGMALIGVSFGLGFMLGPAISGILVQWNPLESYPVLENYGINPFSGAAFFAALLALVNIVWVRSHFTETLKDEHKTDGFLWKRANPLRYFRNSLSINIRLLALVYFLYILSFSGMEFTLTFLAGERLGYGSAENIYIFLYIGFTLLVTQGFIVRRYASVFGEWQLAIAGLICCISGLLTLSLLHSLVYFYIGLSFLGLGMGLANATLLSLVSLFSKKSEQGSNLGLIRSSGSLARGFGPIVAATLYWQLGSTLSYGIGAAIMLPSIILLFASKSLKRDTAS
jgi:MFS family permease